MAADTNNPEVYVDKKPLTPEDIGKAVFKNGALMGTLDKWYQNGAQCTTHGRDGVVVLSPQRHYYACCCSFLG